MIPPKAQRDEWRRLAASATMVSAVGEYTPEEFTVLLDAADELEAQRDRLLAACKIAFETFFGRTIIPGSGEAINALNVAITAAEGGAR